MVFEKYKARKAHAKELAMYSRRELELEHWKLRNPHPPSYEEIYKDTPASAHEQSPQIGIGQRRVDSFTSASSTGSARQ